MFANPTLVSLAGLIPLPQRHCVSSPVNSCCSWPAVSVGDCSYARAPGRPTRESSIFSSVVPRRSSRRGEGDLCGGGTPGGGEGQTEPSCWLIYTPTPPPPPSPFHFPLWLPAFSWTCVLQNQCVYEDAHCRTCTHMHTHAHTSTLAVSHPFSVLSLFPTGEQRPTISDGGDLPFRVPC